MPRLKTRAKHIKVYRPNGTRYANGATNHNLAAAVASAMAAFYLEFGALPKQEETAVEIIGVTGGWGATVLEIQEPKDEAHGDVHIPEPDQDDL